MRTRVNGEARERLRQLLVQRARTWGLTPAAVEQLVGAAALERWPSDHEIDTSEGGAERVAFVVVGAVKLVCETRRGKRVGVAFVPPGRLVAAAWSGEPVATRPPLRLLAHDPLGTIVAFWPPRKLADVVATLGPDGAMRFVGASWRVASDVLAERCRLLGSCLRDRVLAVLMRLARDFGRPHPDGLRIELRLTHQEVAGIAVGSRANVTRALEELRDDGLVAVDGHRLVVTHRALSGLPDEHAPTAARWEEASVAAAQ